MRQKIIFATADARDLSLVICYCVLFSLPLLFYGFPVSTHDGRLHRMWLSNFQAQLWAGEAYPRWLQGMNGGLGSPAFFFYPPVPYFITSLLYPLFRTQSSIWQELGLGAAIGMTASGLCAYAWLKQI